MTEAGSSGLSQARPEARLFRAWTGFAAALAIVPVIRAWQLTGDTGTAVTTLALFAGAAWQVAQLMAVVPQRPSAATRRLALVALGLGLWQLSWISPSDFWFYRVALVLWALVWLALAWGIAGWIWGWRVISAFVLWAGLCDAPWQWSRDAYQTGDSVGPALSEATAKLSGWILWQCGAPVAVHGNLIRLGQYTVTVGIPCTALPLIKLLLLLLALATLLFRLPWLRAVWIALVTTVVSFLISVGRVMLLAYIVRDPPRFHYWHDADGGGGGWFTAVGMLLIAFLVARQVFRQQSSTPAEPSSLPPAPPDPRWIALAGGVLVTLGWSALAPLSPNLTRLPTSPDYILVSNDLPQLTAAAPGPDEPQWTRQIDYAARQGSARLRVVVAYIPRTLSGNPVDRPSLTAQMAPGQVWTVGTGGHFAVNATGQARAWIATSVPGEPAVATVSGWSRHLRGGMLRPARWAAWFLHRQPLRDKRSYWIGLTETGGGHLPPTPPNLFFDWIAVLSQST